MPRPHEDLQHHTLTDHSPGGPPIALAPGSWWAIEVGHVAADRADAAIASYETLIEKARTSSAKGGDGLILCSHNHRRVIALLHLEGHDGFRRLASAWDEHHLVAQRHAIAESRSLLLYRLSRAEGDAVIDPASSDALAFEQVRIGAEKVADLAATLAAAPGFRGAFVFGPDDDGYTSIVYHFAHLPEIEAFRATAHAERILGPAAKAADSFYSVHAMKTFGGS